MDPQDHAHSPEQEALQPVTLTIPQSQHYRLRRLALDARVPMTRLLRAAIASYLATCTEEEASR